MNPNLRSFVLVTLFSTACLTSVSEPCVGSALNCPISSDGGNSDGGSSTLVGGGPSSNFGGGFANMGAGTSGGGTASAGGAAYPTDGSCTGCLTGTLCTELESTTVAACGIDAQSCRACGAGQQCLSGFCLGGPTCRVPRATTRRARVSQSVANELLISPPSAILVQDSMRTATVSVPPMHPWEREPYPSAIRLRNFGTIGSQVTLESDGFFMFRWGENAPWKQADAIAHAQTVVSAPFLDVQAVNNDYLLMRDGNGQVIRPTTAETARSTKGWTMLPEALETDTKVAVAKLYQRDASEMLVVSDFNFTANPAERLTGLMLTIKRRSSLATLTNHFRDQTVEIFVDSQFGRLMPNGVLWGARPTGNSGFASAYFGGPNEMWLLPLQGLTNRNFVVRYASSYGFWPDESASVEVDSIAITLFGCEN
jgi:hypothetical protein